jgi:hypothetical protein
MISVSDAWKEIHKQPLLPETFVEISVGVTDVGVEDELTVTGTNEAMFSRSRFSVKNTSSTTPPKYATLEHNLWALDGSRTVVPSSGTYATPGYVSQDDSLGGVSMVLDEVRQTTIPGLTITWSSEYGEYATDFKVEAKNGDTVVATTTVTGNTSNVTEVVLELTNYDSLTITILGWSEPKHRARIDFISFGHVMVFTKNDIFSYTHEQYGDLNSAELPKNSITFTLDNSDGRWNPSNPTGLARYLSERQRVIVRYGLDVNGVTEWIKAGTFYLSEWRTPSNGMEASFSARDSFEFLINDKSPALRGKISALVNVVALSLPADVVVNIDSALDDYIVTELGEDTQAELIQMGANATRCIIRHDRDGNVNIEPLNLAQTDYVIASALSYTHPEVTLSKPLREVSVRYGEEADDTHYNLSVGNSGERQTVENPFIVSEDQAVLVAEWVRDTMKNRKTVTGEFRADPRLDLFDIVAVESKYGVITPVAITNIQYSYTGAFRASYTGRVLVNENKNTLGTFVLGTSKLS